MHLATHAQPDCKNAIMVPVENTAPGKENIACVPSTARTALPGVLWPTNRVAPLV